MAAWNDILKAKLETLLGERGTGKDAAVRRSEVDAILTKAATLAASKAENAAKAQASEALTVARRAEAAVQSMVASVAETTVQTASDDTAQNERLFQAMSDLFQWNGATYTLRVPASGLVGRVEGDQIALEAIDIAKFAAGLQPVEIVSALPASGNFQGRTVFLTTDNKLYRYTGSAFVASVAAGDIAGQVQAAQIAAIEASKITGQLTDAQISDLGAAKLSGQITQTQITDGSISTAKLAAASVVADKIATSAITADKVAANAITAVKIATGAVEAAKIAAGAVTAGKIAADAVTAGTIAADAVTAGKIAADAVTAGKIAAAAVNAREIAAGAITADKVTTGELITSSAQIRNLTVDTINIADNAVTVPQFATSTNKLTSMTVVLEQQTEVLIWGHLSTVLMKGSGLDRVATLEVNGTVVKHSYYLLNGVQSNGTAAIATSAPSVMHYVSLPAGTHTVVLDAGPGYISGSAYGSTRGSILVMSVKK